MSAAQLVFKGENVCDTSCEVSINDGKVRIEVAGEYYEYYELDRNQAYLLMLYLQDHLGYGSYFKF